jgi:alpha-beta hydrolase superfamily lysophospholipase
VFTVNGFYNMFAGIEYCEKEENLKRIPKDLPILVVSGAEDPVGNFGDGPREVADIYVKTGIRDIVLKIYPGDRHEILNELDHEVVDADILNWLQEKGKLA